ncbi:peptidoglycan recognition family protein [Nocardiopsis sp. RSe5-2]|uniref:Peptidoglycan recognition family protein n=1 Tax=Nocardiopsis endophytica TaxID=3018445 RepID=A0ABT4TY93_9ACTN|nr:peptidoglycan recognition family protein [Nocardiopsis endophytica]MDA2809665.1 peptidoglycan recognition family protein [Nocardiopsis endophytica]
MRRREFVKAGVGGAALAAAAGGTAQAQERQAPADTGADGVPRVLEEAAPAGRGTVRPGIGVDYVAVEPESGGTAEVRFATGEGMTPWRRVHIDGGRDDRPATAALAAAPRGCTGYEVRCEGGAARSTALNVTDGPQVRIGGRRSGGLRSDMGASGAGDLTYLTRAGWGADESLRFDESGQESWPTAYYPVQTITVHHTATELSGDYAADVRGIYYYHAVTQDWGDIGYHLLIDPDGRVYEGRYSGEDGLPVFAELPSPGSAESVTAGHVYLMNSGNIGICMMGDFTDAMPTDAAVDALVKVLRLLCDLTGVPPNTEVEYTNPVNGETAVQMGVSRHRDWMSTECPGDTFAAAFDEVVRPRLEGGYA